MDHPSDAATRFVIDPTHYKKDRAYIGVLVVFSLALIGFGTVAVSADFWWGVAFSGLLFLLVIPYTVIQRNRNDTLQVSPDGVLVLRRGNRDRRPVRISRANPIELTLEHVKDSASDAGIEMTATLNLWETAGGSRRRHILGLWLAQEAKEKAFGEMRKFLLQHGFEVKASNEVAEKRVRKGK